MKKIILSTLAVFAMMTANAENIMQIVPCKATAGTDVYAYINLNNEFDVYTLSFDLVTPTGIRVYTNKNGNLVSTSFAADNTDGRMSYYDEDEEDDVSAFSAAGVVLLGSSFFMDGDQEVFRVGGTGEFPIKNNSGKIFKIRLKVDETVPAGVYPLVMRNACIYDDHSNGVENAVFSSYIVVGEPVTTGLALKGEIPSFVNEALAEEASLATLDLSAVTAVNGDFTYVVGRDVVAPATDVNASVKFDAPRKGAYGSFCAPVDVDVPCYVFDRAQDGFAFFTEATTAPANTPVLISKDVKTTAKTDVLKGVEGRQISSGYYVASDGSGMRSVNSNAVIPALRGAWDIAAASNLRIAIETPTGIQVIGTADEVFGNTYDLKGRQTTNAKNGVFVVNGKKQFVK